MTDDEIAESMAWIHVAISHYDDPIVYTWEDETCCGDPGDCADRCHD